MFNFFKSDEKIFYEQIFSNNISVSKAQNIINKGININKQDENGNSLLFLLVVKKKFKAIKLLLDNNADKYLENRFSKTPLDEACEKSDVQMVRFLLDNGYDIDHKNSAQRTILQNTVIMNNEVIFNVLASYKPNYDLKDNENKTVLFHAVESNNLNILENVLENISDINSLDDNKETALFKAVLKGNQNIVKALINKGIDVNILNKDNENALFNAITLGDSNISVIEELIKNKIDKNVINNNNRNILDEIFYIIDLQSKNLINLYGRYKNIFEKRNYLSLSLLFIKNGFLIDKLDRNNKSTLHKEIEKKNFDNIDFLIKCGANINLKDCKNRNIIFYEILKGYSNHKMIDFLVERGADLNNRDKRDKSIVDTIVELIAISKKYKLLTSELVDIYDEDEDYDFLLKKVLLLKPDLNSARIDGRNILFDLVLYNDFDTLRTIISCGINLNIQDKDGNTPLAFMLEKGLILREKNNFYERLKNFTSYRVLIDIPDNEKRTVLHKAVVANDYFAVQKFIRKNANLNIKDSHGRTALHHTKWKGNHEIAKCLISAGSYVNQIDNAGFTILNYATILGHVKLVMLLVESGVLIYNKNKKNKKVAQFFKDREESLYKMILSNSSDIYIKRTLESIVDTLKKEIDEAL